MMATTTAFQKTLLPIIIFCLAAAAWAGCSSPDGRGTVRNRDSASISKKDSSAVKPVSVDPGLTLPVLNALFMKMALSRI